MSLSRESGPQERQLVRYLLGLLPEEEAERLDEESIVDDDVASRLRTVEDDLVDAYVSGTLDRDTRERFEAVYLATPLRRRKVEFAKRFLLTVDRAAAPAAVGAAPAMSPGDRVRRFTKRPEPGEPARMRRAYSWPPLAAAASLLIACGLLVFQDMQLRQGLSEAQSQSAAQDHRAETLARQLEETRTANAEAAKALERTRQSVAARERQTQPDELRSGTAAVASGMPLAIVLFPQTRSLGAVPAIAVSEGTQGIGFELRIESNDFARYQVALKDPASGRIVWRSAALAARAAGATPFVAVVVPAAVLKTQHYSFELAGLDAAGRGEAISSYAIQIDRR